MTFRHAVRRGVRTGRPTVMVHAAPGGTDGVQVGFVVSKAVGSAVTRNRVKRRLRHLVRNHLAEAPAGTLVVVRALPAAVTRPGNLPSDLGQAWGKALERLEQRAQPLASSAAP